MNYEMPVKTPRRVMLSVYRHYFLASGICHGGKLMRLRQKPWAAQEFEQNPLYVNNPADYRGGWQRAFDAPGPIHLEIGCGKGRFITESALTNPHINFLAMEKQEQIICMALRAAGNAGFPANLRFFCEDAHNLSELFAEEELSQIYINFCDPWRARGKWRKRRLTHRNFLAIYARIMGRGGQLHFKTDDTGLFRFTIEELNDTMWRLKNVSHDLSANPFAGNIMTEYEEKFSGEGKAICRLEAVVRG